MVLSLPEVAAMFVRPWIAQAQPADLARPATDLLDIALQMTGRCRPGALLDGAPVMQYRCALGFAATAALCAVARRTGPGVSLLDVLRAGDLLDAMLAADDEAIDLLDRQDAVERLDGARQAAGEVWQRWSVGAVMPRDGDIVLRFACVAVQFIAVAEFHAEFA